MPRPSGRRRKHRVALGLAALVALAGASLALVAGGPGELARLLASADPRLLGLAVTFLIASDLVKAARLKYILSRLGYRAGLLQCLAARFIGRLMGLATPASVGATPGRAAAIGAFTRMPIGSALGVAFLETLADSVVAALVAAAASIPLLPKSLLLLLLSGFAAFLWILGGLAAASDRVAARIYSRLRLPQSILCKVEAQRRLLVEALGEIRDLRFASAIAGLTLASHLVEALSVAVMLPSSLSPALKALVSLAAVEAAYVASIFPTPGGGGAVEYSLALFLDPAATVYWRLSHIIVGLAPAGLVLAVIPSLRSYLESEALEGGGGCEDLRYARTPVRVQRGRG